MPVALFYFVWIYVKKKNNKELVEVIF